MLEQIAMGLSSLNAAKDIAKGIDSLEKGVAVNQAKIDLQNLILQAQEGLLAANEAQSAAARRVSELEAEIVRLEDWSAEKQRYELRKFYPGTLAYVLKASVAGGEPLHMLCKQCYDETKKSTLQPTGKIEMRYAIYRCGSCRTELPFGQQMPHDADKRLNG